MDYNPSPDSTEHRTNCCQNLRHLKPTLLTHLNQIDDMCGFLGEITTKRSMPPHHRGRNETAGLRPNHEANNTTAKARNVIKISRYNRLLRNPILVVERLRAKTIPAPSACRG